MLVSRRKVMRALCAAPFVPMGIRHRALAQQAARPTLFLEVNLREQVDLMHVMVPPSIAKYDKRQPGSQGKQLSMFAPQSELKEYPNNVFLTDDSLELAPHVDSIALLDTGEAAIGSVHGHEAGNGMRSPGRMMDGGASGMHPLWAGDASEADAGSAHNEKLYGLVPTPASFHNHYQKRLSAQLYNGFVFRGFSNSRHFAYHFGAGLMGAELTRLASKEELFAAYDQVLALPPGHELVETIRGQADVPYRKASGAGYDTLLARHRELGPRHIPGLALSEDEVARWSAGVPAQQCARDDRDIYECPTSFDPNGYPFYSKAQIWEQMAYASKLFRSGGVRSAALEFDFMDLEGDNVRIEAAVRTQAQQVARPLARLIDDLKAVGLYDHTVIAVYTLDGSREPGANSYGDNGKGTILLAGGRIKGGYYGDIVITKDLTQGHEYGFRAPDPTTGELLPVVTAWNDDSKRTPSAAVWRTVVKAMGIPESEYVGRFGPGLDAAAPLDFMLKS